MHINFDIYKFRVVILFLSLISFTPLLAQQRGKATFYSKRATGTRGASGVRLHHDSLISAAEEIGILSQGVATVEVELYREAPQIPFRPGNPMLNLPKIDLEVAEIGYSFIDDLKERKNERVDKLAHHAVSSAHSQHHTRSASVKAANNAQQNTRANEAGKSSVQGGIVKQHVKNQQSKKPAEEDNKWYNVFKKVKNYFVD